MDGLFRTILYILFAEWSGCQITLDIQPKVIQLGISRHMKVRCSLGVDFSKTDTVYSIMLKKGGVSIAVLFQDGSIEMAEPKYNATGSVSTGPFSTAFLELSLDKVTCSDKGEYSCSMAVRRLYASMEIGPVASRVQVMGGPSPVSLTMTPDRPAYTDGEVVNITCSVLKSAEVAHWTWVLPNRKKHTVSSYCIYNESECAHMCTSSTMYTVSRVDAGGSAECRSGELKNEIQINMSHSPVEDNLPLVRMYPNVTTSFPGISNEETSEVTVTNKELTSSTTITQPDRGGTGLTVLYVLVSAFAVILVFTMLHLFLTDRKCKCHHSSTNSFSDSHLTESHLTKGTGSKVIIIHTSDISSVRSHKGMGTHEAAYLHPERPTDSSVLQSETLHAEPVYEEIE
ncbi:uncharacterized protein LOC124255883 isoform X1 [Haliotis rubra]|uniref:uncharacterized protein LOC124255883 isoform X1 n=1 Tax=Haliotis rubra TaxID=36100 RepID=UPI001EE5C4B8|nr:uncharacterized protein LOC124255883 isoform X1 [Haliotis rubra]